MRTLALAVTALLLAGCVTTPPAVPPVTPTYEEEPGPWRVTDCAWGAPRDVPPPDILVMFTARERDGSEARATKFTFADGQYREAASIALTPVSSAYASNRAAVARLGDKTYVAAEEAGREGQWIVRLGATLEVDARAPLDTFGALTAHEGTVYVAGDHLRAYDEDLQLLGEIELPLKTIMGGKLAHDALIHDGIAYLLDDVVMPLYVLRVDVRDPADMRVLDRRSIDGGHLSGHWIDPDASRWNILNSWSGWGGGSVTLHALPFANTTDDITFQIHASRQVPDAPGHQAGFRPIAHLDRTPLWAILWGKEGTILGRMDVEAPLRRIDLCRYGLPLPPDPSPAGIHRDGGFVAGYVNTQLFVLDTRAERPTLLHTQALDHAPFGIAVLG